MNSPSKALRSRPPRHGSSFVVVAAASVATLLFTACDVDRDDTSARWAEDSSAGHPAERQEGGGGAGGGAGGGELDLPEPGDVLTGPCEGDETRLCRGHSPNCLLGRQSCVDGEWSICALDPKGLEDAASDDGNQGGNGGGR